MRDRSRAGPRRGDARGASPRGAEGSGERAGLADSGGQARALIAEGQVRVDGQTELRKTAKMRAGQVVEFAGQRVRVVAPA